MHNDDIWDDYGCGSKRGGETFAIDIQRICNLFESDIKRNLNGCAYNLGTRIYM